MMWTIEELEAVLAESCARSGVPRFVEDPTVLARVAVLTVIPKELAS